MGNIHVRSRSSTWNAHSTKHRASIERISGYLFFLIWFWVFFPPAVRVHERLSRHNADACGSEMCAVDCTQTATAVFLSWPIGSDCISVVSRSAEILQQVQTGNYFNHVNFINWNFFLWPNFPLGISYLKTGMGKLGGRRNGTLYMTPSSVYRMIVDAGWSQRLIHKCRQDTHM